MQLFSVVSLIMGIVLSLVSVTLLIVLFALQHLLPAFTVTAELSALLTWHEILRTVQSGFWGDHYLTWLGPWRPGFGYLTAFLRLPLTGKLSEMWPSWAGRIYALFPAGGSWGSTCFYRYHRFMGFLESPAELFTERSRDYNYRVLRNCR